MEGDGFLWGASSGPLQGELAPNEILEGAIYITLVVPRGIQQGATGGGANRW